MTKRKKPSPLRLVKQPVPLRLVKKDDTAPEIRLLRKANEGLRKKITLQGAAAEIIINTCRELLEDNPPQLVLPKAPKAVYAKEETVALVHVTDVQLGKITSSYDTEICEGRMMELARSVASCVNVHHKSAGVKRLHVFFGGDMVEGETIFAHQPHVIDSSVYDQACKNGPRIFTQMLAYWLGEFEQIKVSCVRGNHGRPGTKHSGNHPRTNWDSVLYEMTKVCIERLMAQNKVPASRLDFRIAEEFYLVDDILGHKVLLVHGDQINGGAFGFPWYGLAKRMGGWADSIPEDWRHVFLGHFHQYASGDINGRGWYAGGTPESSNDFALEVLAAAGLPKQRLQLWTRKHGVVVDLPIHLTHGLAPKKHKSGVFSALRKRGVA